MKKVSARFRSLLFLLFLLPVSLQTYANHLVGMDFYYTWVSGNTYTITLVAYGDCGSASTSLAFSLLPTASPQVYIFNGPATTPIATVSLNIQPPSGGVEITPVCPADTGLTQCTSLSYTIPGIKKFVYSANYTLPGTSTDWQFLFTGQLTNSQAGRATTITNIVSGTFIQLVDTLNNSVTNSSCPIFTNIPTPFFCLDNSDNYNPGAVAASGDSLIFYLVSAMNGTTTSTPGGPVTYLTPATPAVPVSSSTFTFDSHTGQIAFNPNALQRSVVVYNVEQYRSGAFLGTCQREMTFLVQTCTNTPPDGSFTSTTNGIIDNSTHYHICLNNGPFSINIGTTEADTTNDITVTYAGLPTGASFTTTGNGTPHPHSTFTWTSTGVTPGVYTFYVTFTDNNCPLSGTQTIAFTVTIVSAPTLSYSIVSSASCTQKAAVDVTPGGGGSPWTVTLSRPGDTIQTFSPISRTFVDSVPVGTYTYTIYSVAAHSCYYTESITISGPPPVNLSPTFVNPTYCGASNGSITLYNLDPGTIDTVKYTYDGSVHTVIATVTTGGTITLSGLLAGVYSDITATYGYCVSNIAGPVTLVNPAFTMRALTWINPTWCGICNGSVTLYGLRPGQTDTINYTYGGSFQPPVSALIGSDSSITITGLCAGTYDNFTANTAGVCISNTLGPANLTVPPFTMRAITFTNPSYCGICNGTVTLYGLHPGSTDTIEYTWGGSLQPPVAVTIGPDSMATITGLCAGTYDNFTAHAGPSCISNILGPVTLTVPPFTMRAISFTNPSYCGICDGTITLYGLHPGETDTISYTYNGTAQPPVAFTIGSDSMVILTGLCAGVYANFIARTGGDCLSNTLGPVTLTVPPFTMRTISFTNPSYCGICNGTITLYGLHPGETDTISYTYNGAAQTVSALIGPDSMVTLTGLCYGVYANFIARTGGDCVSNTLGPVTLTVPPFTIRALSFVNPVYCGICNGTITIYGVHPGEHDTLNYTYNGAAQTSIALTIPSDSMITLSGLCAGLYDNFVVNTAGTCISNSLGPADLTVPPFTVRTDTFKNPTECGFCNGAIWLFGLFPGETDTVYYYFNDTLQPPVAFTVPADSVVEISGLCQGVISNIVVKTGGDCVSNTLGPDSLHWPPIIPDFSYTINYGCGGDTINCTNLSWPAADLTYVWHFGDGGTSTATDPLHIYVNPGTFNVLLNITNGRCVADTTETISLTNLINAGFTDMPDSFVCQGTPVTFTNTSLGDSLSYNWYFGDGNTATTTNTEHAYKNSGIYTITLAVSNNIPCYDTARRTLAVDSISTISIAATDSVICRGASTTLTGIFAEQGLTGLTWILSNGDSIKNVNPLLQVYDNAGYDTVKLEAYYRACPDTFTSREIRVFNQPNVSLGGDTSICPGSDPILIGDYNNTTVGARWLWSTGATTSAISVVEPGTYWVTVNVSGCETTDSIHVLNDCYINFPNAFTPNGDGLDDYFFPRTLLAKGLATFSMNIYNRWGQLIFTTTSTDGRGWDGRYNDQPQPEGVYVYVIDCTFVDGQRLHHQGNVTLLR